MAVIYKQSERFKFKIEDIEFSIKPLSFHERNTITAMMIEGHQKKDMNKMANASMHTIRCCLKKVKGIQDGDGNEYELTFDENGILTEECMSDLMNMDASAQLIQLCSLFINGVPKEITIPGVSLVKQEDSASKKKTE